MPIPVKEFNGSLSLDEFFILTSTSKVPIIIRNCTFLDDSLFEVTVLEQTTPLTCWSHDEEVLVTMSLGVVRSHFISGHLNYNFFDAHVDSHAMMDDRWLLEACCRLGKYQKNILTWIWTPNQKVTGFHQDPPYNGCGGWMRLSKGIKKWWFFSPKSLEKLDLKVSEANTMTHTEIMALARERLVNLDLYYGVLKGGDLIWFPKSWVHRVETAEPSYGLGGYF